MKKKIILLIICIILIATILGIFLFREDIETNGHKNAVNYLASDISNQKKVKEIIEDTTILGVAELNHNGYIYIFNGQHFGEYGFEMEAYTSANIDNKNQVCLDYYTSEEHDTNYIEEGDILICTGDLTNYDDYMILDDFDTKDNPIIVLKSNDYNEMKKEAITGKRAATVTVGQYYDTSGEIYIQYEISDKEYLLPFALKFTIAEDAQITGELEKGKKINVEYKDLNVALDTLEIKSIKVME